MPLPVTSLYAGLLALMCIILSGMVGQLRGNAKVSLGDGGNRDLVVANRRHMNFVENVPLALLLIALVELNGASKTWVHVLGAVLLIARIIHPFGLSMDKMMMPARIAGAAATIIVLLAAAITLLWQVAR